MVLTIAALIFHSHSAKNPLISCFFGNGVQDKGIGHGQRTNQLHNFKVYLIMDNQALIFLFLINLLKLVQTFRNINHGFLISRYVLKQTTLAYVPSVKNTKKYYTNKRETCLIKLLGQPF